MPPFKPQRLVLVLGDQLSLNLSALRKADKNNTLVLLAELADETHYVPHHKKKIAFVFSAMRHFNQQLRNEGWHTEYLNYGERAGINSFDSLLANAIEKYEPAHIYLTEPNEYRLLELFKAVDEAHPDLLELLPDDRFLCSKDQFREWAIDRKQPRMEYFYRDMRRQTGLLMDGGKPVGGKWNFDKENRKAASGSLHFPAPLAFEPDELSTEVLQLVAATHGENFGELSPFWFAVTREDAERAFAHFLEHALPQFGDYQDAMLQDEKFLFHAVISMYLNAGLLDALDICRQVEQAYHAGHAPLNAAEGFIRQIIGWREYVRGIYWWQMPDYLDNNYLEHVRALPDFYWHGKTDLNCLAQCISQTKQEAYAHHIQRLMVTGNFAMLIGVAPKEIHEWYLAVYADAYEWVELPNTLGMSQFADGGLLGSKPYAGGGNYINKMSDYCAHCRYDVKQKVGESACPLNYLYWHFIDRHEKKLADNMRMKFAYRTWQKMEESRRQEIRDAATTFLNKLQ